MAVFLAALPLVTALPLNLTRLHYNGSAAKSHSTTTQYRWLYYNGSAAKSYSTTTQYRQLCRLKHTLNFFGFQCSLKGWGIIVSFGRLSKGIVNRSPSYIAPVCYYFMWSQTSEVIFLKGQRWQIFCQLTQVWPWTSIYITPAVTPAVTPATSEVLSCVRQAQHLLMFWANVYCLWVFFLRNKPGEKCQTI